MKNKLCICIPTLNRAAFIGQTLEGIVQQLQTGVEVVIVDGGSTDGTAEVVSRFQKRSPCIRYFRADAGEVQPSNAGFDRDCSRAVELANAEYCWLMTDDDVLKPGAVSKVLAALENGHHLLVASCEIRDFSLQSTLMAARPGLREDKCFPPSQWEQFFRLALMHLTFVGAVIVKRSVWLEREPERYFGSGFVHVGVIFCRPLSGTTLVLAEPLVVIRYGNALWCRRAFEIFMLQWPELVWAFPGISDAAKQAITPRQPWRSWRVLLLQRAYGRYSVSEFERYVAARLPKRRQRWIARTIATIPLSILYPPAWLYGRLFHPHPHYFISTLKDGLRQQ